MPDSSCGICAFFGRATTSDHPKVGSRREEVLHAALAGCRPIRIAEMTGLDEVYVNGVMWDLRGVGLLPAATGPVRGTDRKRARRAA